MKHKLLNLTTLTFLTVFTANANATRWFEIELIAFEQKPTPELREDFKLERKPIQARKTLDMLLRGDLKYLTYDPVLGWAIKENGETEIYK